MKLIVYRAISDVPLQQPGVKVIPWVEFREWLRPHNLLRHLLRYDAIAFHIYRLDIIGRPFFLVLLMRLMAHGAVQFVDSERNHYPINLSMLVRGAGQFIRDSFQRSALLKRVHREVSATQAIKSADQRPLDLEATPIYLRTDMTFGPISGGSVGHIAGVLNNLAQFSGSPVFITTEHIATVHPDIETHRIQFPHSFRDFPPYWEIASTYLIEEQAQKYIGGRNLAFIYQRYSIKNFTGCRLARSCKVPFVLEYNGSEIWINRHWVSAKMPHEALALEIELLNLHAADLIVVVSDPSKEELVSRGIEPAKILVNPNGVDTDRFSPDVDGSEVRRRYGLENKTVIGFIGTFGAWHGAEVLANAFGMLLSQFPDYRENVRLLLIGDGLKLPEVKANLDKHSVMDYAVLTGLVPQVQGPSYLAAADILASPHVPNADGSKFFGSPTKLFEYMAMGRGIVASDLDQIGEILKHQQTAWMVKPGDVDELVAGLKHLIDHDHLRAQLGQAARAEVIQNYTWREHTSRIIERLKIQYQ